MQRQAVLSEEYLKAITGKFDLETIFNIELSNMSISNLGSLPKCISLVYLDISQNKLTSIKGIENLTMLSFLDLSCNNITDISPLGELRLLRNIKLYGNNINSITPLTKLARLEKLSFKTFPFEDKPNLNVTNPICNSSNYRKSVFSEIKSLKWLDDLPKNMDEFNCEDNDNDKNIDEMLRLDKFDFNFKDKIKIDAQDLIPDDEVEKTKKEINDKYNEFHKEIEEIKKELAKTK